MKPAISFHRTRWSCRIVRGWVSICSEGRRRGLAARHIAGCAECRGYFAAADELEASLRGSAVRQFAPSPAGLDQRIMQAIAHSTRESVEPARPGRIGLFAIGSVAVAAAVAIAVIQPWRNAPPLADPVAATDLAITTAPADSAVASWTSLTAPVTSLLAHDPLQAEAASVYADARSAARFLALNFLPSTTTAGPSNDVVPSTRRSANGG